MSELLTAVAALVLLAACWWALRAFATALDDEQGDEG